MYHPCFLLQISSLFFITNIISSVYYQQYIYSLLFSFLTMTSILFHSMPNLYTNIIDKCAIGSVVCYGGYVLYSKIRTIEVSYIQVSLIVSSFLMVIVLYLYGYCTNQYCYDKDVCVGDKYHCLLHTISSLGHHGILLL